MNTRLSGWVAVFLVGCEDAPIPSPIVSQWVDAVPSTTQPMVRLADEGELRGATVSLDEEAGTLHADVWWAPGPSTDAQTTELTLWAAGGRKPVATWSGRVPDGHDDVARFTLDAPVQLDPGGRSFWLMWNMATPSGEVIGVSSYPGGRVPIGAVRTGAEPLHDAPLVSDPAGPRMVVGGDVNLGRRQNGITGLAGPGAAFDGLPQMSSADLAFVNLESVLTSTGEDRVAKGEDVPFYFRGRPEQVAILTAAGIDIVATGNNHVLDYGPEGLQQQIGILDTAGVAHVGAGPDRLRACAPVMVRIGALRAAFLSADFTLDLFSATADRPGTCHWSLKDGAAFVADAARTIAALRHQVDLVFVAVHWGPNVSSRPVRTVRRIGRGLIRAGADAVLGSSAHVLQGVEIIEGRPILYDAGNLLWDSHQKGESTRSGLFELWLSASGVTQVTLTPVDLGYGRTTLAEGNSAARTLSRFRDLSNELGTAAHLQGGKAWIGLPTPPDRAPPSDPVELSERTQGAVPADTVPPPGCVVDAVPEDARITPIQWGPVQLLGARMSAERITRRETVWVETWWTVSAPVETPQWVFQRMKTQPRDWDRQWWADHEHCDWAWPITRWTPGEIVRDAYGVRPPKTARKGTYELEVGLVRAGRYRGKGAVVGELVYE